MRTEDRKTAKWYKQFKMKTEETRFPKGFHGTPILPKGFMKKARTAGYDVGGYTLAICDTCGRDCAKEDHTSLKKWKEDLVFRGDDEQIECKCIYCFNKSLAK